MKIFIADIYREKSGLALSSRNKRLSVEERKKAKIIYEALQLGKKCFFTKNAELKDVISCVKEKLSEEELVQKIYYVELRRVEKSNKHVLLVSVQFAGIHLIDNLIM